MRKGAASYYIVAFSTLILVVIATSFATVIISEVTRSSNDDLSQSAYDSALAGVEDAKIAFANYRRCVEAQRTNSAIKAEEPMGGSTTVTCNEILYWMENPDCYMVGHILGKIPKDQEAEVVVGGVQTTADGGKTVSDTNQAYTCVQINTKLSDYRATLSNNNPRQTFKASTEGGASNVKRIKLSWYAVRTDFTVQYSNFDGSKVSFASVTDIKSRLSKPPTVELQILQTGSSFTMANFDIADIDYNRTNRATLYLVPTDQSSGCSGGNNANCIWKGTGTITAAEVTRTNSRTVANKPFVIRCGNSKATTEFYCSTEIELPSPVGGGNRNDDTFLLSVSLPYQAPDTDFSVELCNDKDCWSADAGGNTNPGNKASIENTQISIDSTGRANDLYRRVETRLETTDTTFGMGYPQYALQVLGGGGVDKKMTVTREYNFRF